MGGGPAIFLLGSSALPLAERLKSVLGGEIHGPQSITEADHNYSKATAALQSLFNHGEPIIGLCASGILIRALAPFLEAKEREPPVIAVAEDGSAVVPLLGGHHGANELARRIADLTGGRAAITTASDIRFGVGIDEPPRGYVLANPDDAKEFAARLLAGEAVSILGSAPWLPFLSQPDAPLEICVTDAAVKRSARRLVYHPQVIAVGIGCERGSTPDEMINLVTSVLAANEIAPQSVALVASLDLKSDEPAIHAAADHLGVPARFFPAGALHAQSDRMKTPSPLVMKEVGTPGVAEGAALAAVGQDGALIVAKTKQRRTTCAIARAIAPIFPEHAGSARGTLSIVGIGPGGREWCSFRARQALQEASDWVGYTLYLDLIADLKTSQTEHRFSLGAEEERVRHAIALASQGRRVGLVSSGDPGIYAMAALVFEILDHQPERIAVEVIPGISAIQAAAAKAGGFIGNDFCCISLSDLLTPWETIERRVRAAAEADFVVAFYNPRSEKRRDQLDRAMAILRQHRPNATPVVIASRIARSEETVQIVPLAAFDSTSVDMMTIVMVGSSQSRSFTRGDGRIYAYVPRGYPAKRKATA